MAARIDKLINEVYRGELEREKLISSRRKTQLNALQSQINPHFLGNMLESIRMRSLINDERETADILKKLGRLFHRITYWKDDMVTLKEELNFVRDYLEIQSYLMEGRLEWSVSCPAWLEDTPLPKVSVQGLVENACLHGIFPKGEAGKIDVAVVLEADRVGICVTDDGVGMDVSPEGGEGNHSGLDNIRERLRMHYGEGAVLSVESEPGRGTAVFIGLPVKEGHPG